MGDTMSRKATDQKTERQNPAAEPVALTDEELTKAVGGLQECTVSKLKKGDAPPTASRLPDAVSKGG